MKNILYATDLNPLSAHVLAYAVDIATRCDGAITVVHALDPQSIVVLRGDKEQFRRDMIRKVEVMLAADLQACEQGGSAAILDVCVEFGHAADVILRVARQKQADMVVMGSRGYSAEPHMLGEVLKPVLTDCRVPVVVVPMPRPALWSVASGADLAPRAGT